jgi:dethiobiotin synthetase
MQGLTVVASGNDSDVVRAAEGAAAACEHVGKQASLYAPLRFEVAAAPLVAAAMEGTELDPPALLEGARAAASGDVLITALPGGLLAPVTERYSIRDLARDLGAPVVVATWTRPGLVNEALTTIAAARGGALQVAGVILAGFGDDPGRVIRDERAALERLAGVPVVTLPPDADLYEVTRRWPIDDWLEPTPDAHAVEAIEQQAEVVLDPYTEWEQTPQGDPRQTPRPLIMAAMEAIIAAEGPMTATRAYSLYNKASGGRKLTSVARAPLSSAVYWLAREGKIALTREADVPWQGDDVVRMPDHPEVRVRELGARELIEVPLDEIAELMRRLRAARGVGDPDGLKRAVLNAYGLVRLTARADEYLGLAFDLAAEPAGTP